MWLDDTRGRRDGETARAASLLSNAGPEDAQGRPDRALLLSHG